MVIFSNFQKRGLGLLAGMLFCFAAFAKTLTCDVCGMYVAEHARNHVAFHTSSTADKAMHVCSPSCAHKFRKHSPNYSQVEVTNFNHPEKTLDGSKAFFLIQSSKIKADMGENVMAPYAAAFVSQEEADAAKVKYGDGVVVQGSESAFK